MKKYTELQKLEATSGQKILLFSADWCKDCKILENYLEQVIAANKSWEFIYVDLDEHPKVAEQYDILGIPSFVALCEGERVSDLISKDSKSEAEINQWIKELETINND